MPNSAIAPPPLQFPATPQDYIKYLLKYRGVTVQKMCEDLYPALSKSTVDKWLSFQTTETSFSNVKAMVKYLGGSLDYLAQIEAASDSASSASSAPAALPVPADGKKAHDDYPALRLLVESYEKEIIRTSEQHQQEIGRVSAVHEKYLAHVVELVETGRQALIAQHTATVQHMREACDSAVAHTRELCASAVDEKQQHLNSFRGGRDFWRVCAVVGFGLVIGIVIWLVWEFSNLNLGLTGHLLRQAGLIN